MAALILQQKHAALQYRAWVSADLPAVFLWLTMWTVACSTISGHGDGVVRENRSDTHREQACDLNKKLKVQPWNHR